MRGRSGWILGILGLGGIAGATEGSGASGLPTAEATSLPCGWAEGTTFRYTHVHRRTDAGKPHLGALTTTAPVVVRIATAGDPGSWHYDPGPAVVSGPPEGAGLMGAALAEIDPPALHLVWQDQGIADLANLSEVVDALAPAYRRILGPDLAPEKISEALEALRQPWMGMPFLLEDPRRMLALQCTQMALGQRIEGPRRFENPLGGPPLEGTSVMTLVRHDPEARTVTFTLDEHIDPDAFAAVLLRILGHATVNQEALDDAALAKALEGLPPFPLGLKGEWVMSLDDGFPLAVELIDAVGAPDHPGHRSDVWSWTRVTDRG